MSQKPLIVPPEIRITVNYKGRARNEIYITEECLENSALGQKATLGQFVFQVLNDLRSKVPKNARPRPW